MLKTGLCHISYKNNCDYFIYLAGSGSELLIIDSSLEKIINDIKILWNLYLEE